MSKEVDKIRKRIEKRKLEQSKLEKKNTNKGKKSTTQKITKKIDEFPVFEQSESSDIHPLFRRDIFAFKVLFSTLLVLIVGISYSRDGGVFERTREVVQVVMEKEFQFATASKWYEDNFGDAFAIFPTKKNVDGNETELVSGAGYSVPVAGKISKSFTEDGQGIHIATTLDNTVGAVMDGIVIEISTGENDAKTVKVNHPDGSETWYGNITDVKVKLYDTIKAKDVIGKVTSVSDGTTGEFYFAMKKDNKFIDPNTVISFE